MDTSWFQQRIRGKFEVQELAEPFPTSFPIMRQCQVTSELSTSPPDCAFEVGIHQDQHVARERTPKDFIGVPGHRPQSKASPMPAAKVVFAKIASSSRPCNTSGTACDCVLSQEFNVLKPAADVHLSKLPVLSPLPRQSYRRTSMRLAASKRAHRTHAM